jgi:NADH:ubiquinone oxidoreductase subunit E
MNFMLNLAHRKINKKDMQHCGRMNCRLTGGSKVNKRLRDEIEW